MNVMNAGKVTLLTSGSPDPDYGATPFQRLQYLFTPNKTSHVNMVKFLIISIGVS